MILTNLEIDPAELERRTGWAVKPQGACKDVRCVPLPEGPLTAHVLEERLGMPLVHDEETDLYALGPESGGRALGSAETPDKPPGMILDQVRRGWMIGNRVLRPAGVRIAKAPESGSAEGRASGKPEES